MVWGLAWIIACHRCKLMKFYSLGSRTMCAQLFRRKLVTFGHFSHVNFVHEGVCRDAVLLCWSLIWSFSPLSTSIFSVTTDCHQILNHCPPIALYLGVINWWLLLKIYLVLGPDKVKTFLRWSTVWINVSMFQTSWVTGRSMWRFKTEARTSFIGPRSGWWAGNFVTLQSI